MSNGDWKEYLRNRKPKTKFKKLNNEWKLFGLRAVPKSQEKPKNFICKYCKTGFEKDIQLAGHMPRAHAFLKPQKKIKKRDVKANRDQLVKAGRTPRGRKRTSLVYKLFGPSGIINS